MSKNIKILGTGCPNCLKTIAVVQEVVQENNIDATIVKVDDIMDIMKYDILATPAVVVDEVIIIKGRVPNKKELLEKLTN